jgi:hypothetical protein
MANPFTQIVKDNLLPEDRIEKPLRVLREFCDGIEEATEGKILCTLEEGFLTNLGQEWRIMVQPGRSGPKTILLRAHVHADGFPVQLDFYDEDLVPCKDEAVLVRRLSEFLARKNTQNALSLLLRHGSRSARKSRNGASS